MVQEIVEVVDETPKKTTQKVDNNLDKHNATKKIEKHKLETHKKRTHEKAKIIGEGVPKVDGGLDKPIATKKIRQPITMEVLGPRNKEVAQELQKSKDMDASKSNNGEKPGSNFHPSSSQPLKVSQNQPLAQVKETINEVETNKNREEDKGTSKRRTRGKTLMKKIHARTMEEREEVIFNEDGQPIGPSKKVVSGFSLFLGTLARNATFCPLIYTNWSKMPKKNRRRCWRYSQRKYILPAEARKWVVTTVPEAHFKNLCEYWTKEDIQAISAKNTRNRAQLKWVHRMGPQNFSLTREELRAKEGREPTQ
ncbi:hypothetical protein P8452_42551 [Trifolium repens]|nr:hypothetical protein P8452_42551 [Trifolium repens]